MPSEMQTKPAEGLSSNNMRLSGQGAAYLHALAIDHGARRHRPEGSKRFRDC